jgi:hypothetical protein
VLRLNLDVSGLVALFVTHLRKRLSFSSVILDYNHKAGLRGKRTAPRLLPRGSYNYV